MLMMTAAPETGMITGMPELDEMITIAEAVEMANGRYTRQRIAQVAKNGDIPGSALVSRIWLLPRAAFEQWLNEERRPGPKTEE